MAWITQARQPSPAAAALAYARPSSVLHTTAGASKRSTDCCIIDHRVAGPIRLASRIMTASRTKAPSGLTGPAERLIPYDRPAAEFYVSARPSSPDGIAAKARFEAFQQWFGLPHRAWASPKSPQFALNHVFRASLGISFLHRPALVLEFDRLSGGQRASLTVREDYLDTKGVMYGQEESPRGQGQKGYG